MEKNQKKYELLKIFKFHNFPEDIQEKFLNLETVTWKPEIAHTYFRYTVSVVPDPFEGNEHIPISHYLISQGAAKGESVLIID